MFFRFVCCLVVVRLISTSDADSCSEPPPVDNSIFVAKEVEGQILGTYFCIKGYHLVGEKTFSCNASKEWNGPTAKCRDCGPPGNPPHGYFEGNDFTRGATITYYCEEGYRLVGTQEQRCVDGEWSGALPSCEAPKPAPRTAFERALLAFQESKDLCQATENFMQRLKECKLTMEELKYSLEEKKAELKEKM
uniref:Complement component 4 binding protein beta n=1 Tax=Propithecus coquereli TaxID=379532 RepID=A0A2K6GJE7_PROCO